MSTHYSQSGLLDVFHRVAESGEQDTVAREYCYKMCELIEERTELTMTQDELDGLTVIAADKVRKMNEEVLMDAVALGVEECKKLSA